MRLSVTLSLIANVTGQRCSLFLYVCSAEEREKQHKRVQNKRERESVKFPEPYVDEGYDRAPKRGRPTGYSYDDNYTDFTSDSRRRLRPPPHYEDEYYSHEYYDHEYYDHEYYDYDYYYR